MSKGRAAVILQRAEQWVGVDLVARAVQNNAATVKPAAAVVTDVVAQRGRRYALEEDIDTTSPKNRVPDRNRRLGSCVPDPVARVVAESAVSDRKRLICASVVDPVA